MKRLSQERVLQTLLGLGFSKTEAEVYLILSRKGPQKAIELGKALKLTKQQLYPCLKNLQGKAVVSVSLEHPARFSAVPFEQVLDLFIKAKMEEAQRIQQSKDKILSDWQSIAVGEAEDSSPKFMVLEGRNAIYSRIKQMIQETKKQLSFVSTVPALLQADQLGLFDAAFDRSSKAKIKFRFLTELSEQNVVPVKNLLAEATSAELDFQGRTPDLGLRLFPRMFVRDDEEIMFFTKPVANSSKIEQGDACLWTNCKTLVQAFTAIFQELWRNGTDMIKKIDEIERCKPNQRTYVIADADTAEKKYDETLQLAKKEIIMTTSSQGLIECLKNKPLLEKQNMGGISIKILAPIVRENLEAAEQLSKLFEVKHALINSLETTIIDENHLFQFNTRSPNQEEPEVTPHFENTFYTNDPEYIKKMKTTLNEIWKNSQAPSTVTLETITGLSGPSVMPLPMDNPLKILYAYGVSDALPRVIDIKPPGTITEKDVLNKIINAKKFIVKNPAKDITRTYASLGEAVFHLPEKFNLPDMIIRAAHLDKQSSYGPEDYLFVLLCLETPKGRGFVPVALAAENPDAQEFVRLNFANSPAGENFQLLKKDQLQISMHGNTLFAGWTVPIQLYPAKYTLPPACILFEGYGDVKTRAYTILVSSGFKHMIEENYFDAFVTFLHPSSKYSGPGTDGVFSRDFIVTIYPPS